VKNLKICGRRKGYSVYSADTTGTVPVPNWPISMLKYKYIFQIKYTKAILSNSTLFRFEISKMPIAL